MTGRSTEYLVLSTQYWVQNRRLVIAPFGTLILAFDPVWRCIALELHSEEIECDAR
jgi:hypothetical protein